jgi:anti-sigma factor RsiW
MTCHEYESDLDDFVDGALPADRVAAVEAHLSTCVSCRALATDLRTLHTVAANLERRTPPPQVWTHIAAAIHAESRTSWWQSFNPFRSWQPALAGAVMLALLTTATWYAWREAATGRAPQTTTAENTRVVNTVDATVPISGLEATRALDTEIAHWERIVNDSAEVLPGETKAVYRVNTSAINEAIGQNRAALETEPTNNLAQQSLFEALRSKLALLQDMVALINEMRKGNQEGAARIVSGMEQ